MLEVKMYYMYTDEELRSLCRQNIESLEMWARRIIHDQFTQKYEIDEVVCRWISKLLDYELEIQEAITETHRELEFLVHTYME